MALVVVPLPLVQVLFERGAFGPEDTAATALAVAIYGLGLPAFVMQKALQPLFFAREDTKRPFYYALVAMVVNAVVAIGLATQIGYIAAAFGTTLAGWAMVVLLWRGSRGMGEAAEIDRLFRRRLPRIVLASVVMGMALWALMLALGPLFAGAGQVWGLLVLVLGGMVVYFGLAQLLGAFRLSELRAALRR